MTEVDTKNASLEISRDSKHYPWFEVDSIVDVNLHCFQLPEMANVGVSLVSVGGGVTFL